LHDSAVASFKEALRKHDDQVVLDEFYYSSTAAALDRPQEAGLRREIAGRFNVAMRDVIVTGSAKLGFTLVGKPGRPSFSPFGDTSDIDVAIISTDLYVQLWKLLHMYSLSGGPWNNDNSFRKYFVRGWLRPDKLPSGEEFPFQGEWFEYFRGLTASGRYGPYKIAAGIYYGEMFWEQYAVSAINQARLQAERPL